MSPADTQAAVNSEVRFSQLDDQMRGLTGQIEEITYNLAQMKRRLDTLASDIDQRLSAVEHGPAAGGVAAAAPAAGAGAPPAPPPPPPPRRGAPPAAPARPRGAA